MRTVKTSGTITEKYLAIARPSGRAAPRDTELYGQFKKMGDAEYEQKARGGRIVQVEEITTWVLSEKVEQPFWEDLADKAKDGFRKF